MGRKTRLAVLAAVVAGVLALPAAASANTSVSTTSLNLGSELVGTTSGSQPVTVTVSCTTTFGLSCTTQGQFDAAASGGSSGITGPAAGDFSQTNNCPVGTLNSGSLAGNTGSCQFNLSFTPSAAGTRTATLDVGSDGSTNATQPNPVSLTGTGFTTVVPPVPGTTPAPTGQRARAIKKCKKKSPKGPRRTKCIKKAKKLPV